MSPWMWLMPVATFFIGYRISSGARAPGWVAALALVGIVLLSRRV